MSTHRLARNKKQTTIIDNLILLYLLKFQRQHHHKSYSGDNKRTFKFLLSSKTLHKLFLSPTCCSTEREPRKTNKFSQFHQKQIFRIPTNHHLGKENSLRKDCPHFTEHNLIFTFRFHPKSEFGAVGALHL